MGLVLCAFVKDTTKIHFNSDIKLRFRKACFFTPAMHSLSETKKPRTGFLLNTFLSERKWKTQGSFISLLNIQPSD